MPPAPPPIHTLRTHSAPIASLAFAADNSLIYSGDQDGFLSITDAKTRRALALWKGHEAGVLGVQEWDGRLISHGRDNYIHIHHRLPPHRRLSPNTGPGVWKSLSVNALNFCRFALLPLSPADRVVLGTSTSSRGYQDQRAKQNEAVERGVAHLSLDDAVVDVDRSGKGEGGGAAQDTLDQAQSQESHVEQVALHSRETERPETQAEALLAVPNLLDSELCDIYHLPSLRRLHAGINTPPPPSTSSGNTGVSVGAEGKNKDRTGLIMALHLGYLPTQVQETEWERVGAVMSFEDGRVEMWGIPRLEIVDDGNGRGTGEGITGGLRGTGRLGMFSDGSGKVGKRVWERMYEVKGHNEAVMGMAVASDMSAVYTVSADHLLMKHSLAPAHITHGNGNTDRNPRETTRPSSIASSSSASSASSSTPTSASSTDIPPTACPTDPPTASISLRSTGHSSISISPSLIHPILAVGGWDGHVRLFSARTLKSLGTLRYHRDGVQALAFASAPFALRDSRSRSGGHDEKQARSVVGSTIDLDFVSDSASAHTGDSDSDAASTLDERGPGNGAGEGAGDSSSGSDTETETPADKGAGAGRIVRSKGQKGEAPRERWLVSGGKDRRVAIWGLMDFAQAGQAV